MELVPGISAHFVQSKSLKQIKSLFVLLLPLSLVTIAGRMLSASMLEAANQAYPTSQAFRRYLGKFIWNRYFHKCLS